MDVVAIIDKLAEFGFVRPGRVIGNYYQIHCPFHNNGQERKPSCGVLLHDEVRNGQHYRAGWFHCFACAYAKNLQEAVTDILRLHSISQSGLDWLVANIPGFTPEYEIDDLVPKDILESVSNKYALDYIQQQQNNVQFPMVSEEELAGYRYTVPYMYERGLTDQIIADYDIGVDMNWIPPGRKNVLPCITFPVRNLQGQTLFLCRRSIQGKFFNYPEGVIKPVYGIERIPKNCKSLVLCESCLDALIAVKYGYPAVALLGTGNPYQMQQLRELSIPEFVICTDGDEAGRKAARRIKKALSSVAFVWTVPMPEGSDINDIKTKEEFDQLYQQRT